MDRCKEAGHNYIKFDEDKTKLAERCQECGKVNTVYKEDQQGYAKAHKRDFIQPHQKEWDITWKKEQEQSDKDRAEEINQEQDKGMEEEEKEFYKNKGIHKYTIYT